MNPRFDLADGGRELGRRHIAAQQHLVADHHGLYGVGIAVGDGDRVFQPHPVLGGVVGYPEALQHLESDLGGDAGDLFEALVAE